MRTRRVHTFFASAILGLLSLWAASLQPANAAGPIDFEGLENLDGLVDIQFGRAIVNRRTGQQSTDMVVTNTSSDDISCPLAFVITSFSLPDVSLANPTGITPDGDPFVDLSSQVGDDGILSPGESTTPLTLVFNNPSRGRFTFDSSCLGALVLGELAVIIESPENRTVTAESAIDVSGTASAATSVEVNGVGASLGGDAFTAVGVPLAEGANALVATAQNADGQTASATISVRRDTRPPVIVFETPSDGDRFVTDTIEVAGTVNDIIPGATVNADDVTVTINGQPAAVDNRTFFQSGFPLVVGTNTLTAVATDVAGNSAETSITVTREPDLAGVQILVTGGNGQRVPINSPLPEALSVQVQQEGGGVEVGRPVTFGVSRGDGLIGDPDNSQRSLTLLTDSNGLAQINFTVGSRTGEGFHRVRVTTPGSLTFAEFCATAETSPPVNIAVVMPPPSQALAGQPLIDPIAGFVTDQGGNPVAGVAVTFQVQRGDGTLNGQQSVAVPTNSDGISEVEWTLGVDPGVSNNEVTATFEGNSGFPATYIVSGVVTGSVAETTVSGLVQDSTAVPIQGVKAVIRGTDLEAFTGSDGRFVITNVSPGGHHVGIVGSTANDPNEGIFFPNIDYAVEVFSGVENRLDQIVVLPFVDMANAQLAGGDEDVTLIMDGVPNASVTILAHSTFVKDPNTGEFVQQPVLMSTSQVKIDKLPMAPPQGSAPVMVGTLQPPGVFFDPPAQITMPNFDSLAPGDTSDLFSFDHELGQFVNIGPGTVSEDGAVITSDPGFGIVQSGWFCNIRFPGPAAQCTNINGCSATLAWTATHTAGGTSGSGGAQAPEDSKPIVVCVPIDPTTTDRDEIEITVVFSHETPPSGEVPTGGQIKSVDSDWTVDESKLEIVSQSGSGNTATLKVKTETDTGTVEVKSPIYTIEFQDQGGEPVPDATCQVTFDVHIIAVEIEVNETPEPEDDYVTWAPTFCRARVVGLKNDNPDFEVVLANDDPTTIADGGDVLFAEIQDPWPADTTATEETLELALPASGDWVQFILAGKFGKPSVNDKDAIIDVRLESDTGPVCDNHELMVRVRKNANDLTASERDRYVNAVLALHAAGNYAVYNSIHGTAVWEAHFNSGFLPWHRAFVLDLERELQKIDPSVAVPYWKFDAAATNVFANNFMGANDSAGNVTGKFAAWQITNPVTGVLQNIVRDTKNHQGSPATEQPLLSESATLALGSTFAGFRGMEGNPHGSAHVWVGGHMGSIPTAVMDPIFFFLHSNVDRLWAKWQVNHRGDGPSAYDGTGSARVGHNLNDTMWPWNQVTGTFSGGSDNGSRPTTAPGGMFPSASVGFKLGPNATPQIREMLDYEGRVDPEKGLGFSYDDIPYNP